MFAQMVTFEEQPAEIDEGIRHVKEEVLPVLRDAAGLTGFWLVDREAGKRISLMIWESEEASAAAWDALQARFAELGDPPRPPPSSVERYEVYGSV
jgi:hypothetical protein